MSHPRPPVRSSRVRYRSPKLVAACLLLFVSGLLVHVVGVLTASLVLALLGLAGVVAAALLPVAALLKVVFASWIAAGPPRDRPGT